MSSYLSKELRRLIRADAGYYCGYCQCAEHLLAMPLEVEHIIPESSGGETVRHNLWLACHRCNQFKSVRYQFLDQATDVIVPLFNPRTQLWSEHFRWHPSGTKISGLTACGRATVNALQLNNDYAVETRRYWVIAGWHPPTPEQLNLR